MKNIITNNFITPQYDKKGIFLRKINSFSCRSRFLKKNIVNLLQKYWCDFGCNFQNYYIDFNNIFVRKNFPIILEIGFGCGENLFHTALQNKQYNVLGIEVYMPGIVSLIKKIHFSKITIDNIKIIPHDAREVLQYMVCNHTVHVIQLLFPDPWPKKSHHKRRILQKSFVILLANKLVHNGILHIVTDCISYAQYIINIMNTVHFFINVSNFFNPSMLTYLSKISKFGKKAALNKKNIFNLIFQLRK